MATTITTTCDRCHDVIGGPHPTATWKYLSDSGRQLLAQTDLCGACYLALREFLLGAEDA